MLKRSLALYARVLAIAILLALVPVPAFAEAPSSASPPSETVSVEIPREELDLLRALRGVQDLVLRFHNKDISTKQLYEGALRGLLQSLGDPYSQYLDEQQLNSLNTSLESEYSGVGITIELISGNITVVGTFPGSPAARAGIKPGDVLLRAGGYDLTGKMPQDASLVIRGEPGTSVELVIRRPPQNEILTFALKRERITQPTISWKDLGGGLYYVQIAQFTTRTGVEFPVLMDFLRERGLRGLVLDLRDNPGGLLDSCVKVADELVPAGPVVELRLRNGKQVLESDRTDPVVPAVVLVNRGSASASEILAGAIRDRGVGILVGDRTFGKASVQSIIPIGDGLGGVRMTIADYYTPAGVNLSGTGLEPDVAVTPAAVEPPQSIDYERPLSRGMIGLDVQAAQLALNFIGRDAGKADGILGPATWAALQQFCQDRGITLGDAAGDSVIGALNEAVAETARNAPDEALDSATRILQTKLATGSW